MTIYSSNLPWTQMEETIVKAYWPKESIDAICEMLPSRNKEAVINKARKLGLEKMNNNATIKPKTIEQLEAELNLKKAEAELETALAKYDLFRGQCRASFTQAMRNNTEVTIEDLFKLNAKDFSRYTLAISNAYRKILKSQVEQDLL